MELLFKKLDEAAKLPTRGNPGDAGLDIYSIEHIQLVPGEMLPVRTGLAVSIPYGHFGRVSGRSGLAFKKGIIAFEGTIDHGFTGEFNVLVLNVSERVYDVYPGDRIAQLIVIPYAILKPAFAEDLGDSERGDNGFGSTGR